MAQCRAFNAVLFKTCEIKYTNLKLKELSLSGPGRREERKSSENESLQRYIIKLNQAMPKQIWWRVFNFGAKNFSTSIK